MLLNATQVTKKYDDLTAVDHLNLKVDRGQIYGLLGPNGSGKSTLIKTIVGFLKPDSGQIHLFNGVSPGDNLARKKIGYMPQNPSIYEGLSVWENIYFFGKLFKMSDAAIEHKGSELLKTLALESKKDILARNLSGGMIRRLSLASCLIHSPELILLDEPTAGVDPVLRIQFWDYFKKLAQGGTGIIITTHHISEAARCHKVGFMRAGRIFLEDSPEKLIKHYSAKDLEEAFVNATSDKQ